MYRILLFDEKFLTECFSKARLQIPLTHVFSALRAEVLSLF